MKKKIVVLFLLAAASIGYIVMPQMVESTIPTAYYITPHLKAYENAINCTGTIQSEQVRQVVLQAPIVAEEVYVEIGDVVREGDPLLRIDAEKTGNMGLSLSLIKDVSDELGAGSGAVDWAALASSYGLSAVVNGSAAPSIDAAVLESLLNDTGLLSGGDQDIVLADNVQGEIGAPISGVVTGVEVQKGIPAAAGKAIVTVADNQNYKVQATIREEDVGRVQVGDIAKVRGVGFSGALYTGVITKVYPTARKTLSGTTSETVVDAEITLDNPDKRLKPGFSAKVEIFCGNDYNLITVPYEAVKQDENNNEYVYLYEGGKLKKQLVVTGQEMTDEVEILDGVSVDSVVVYNPSEAVKEGAMIHIKGRANVD